jgi:HTH-type transcriptional regulator, competence development regulator
LEEFKLGPYLKSLRLKKQLSIRKLEELSGVSNSYISQMEKGERRPSPEILYKLTNPLGVDHVHLMIKAGHLQGEENDYLETEYETDLREKEMEQYRERKKEREYKQNNLVNVLFRPEIHYNGRKITTRERIKLSDMADIILGEKEE